MSDQKPKATRDGLTWTNDDDAIERPADRPVPGATSKLPRHRGRLGKVLMIVLAAAVAGLLVWTLMERITAPEPAPIPTGSGAAKPQGTEAEKVALRYENGWKNLDTTVCVLDVDPSGCERVMKVGVKFTMSEAPHVIESAPVRRGGGVTGEEKATAVLMQFTIQGQSSAQRVISFVRDGDLKIVDSENVGSSDAGKTFQQLFEEAAA